VKPEKIREQTVDELRKTERELVEQLFRMRISKSIGQLDSASKIQATRRHIARVKTILREKEAAAKA
jgi:large subunit ribosomal protein L29